MRVSGPFVQCGSRCVDGVFRVKELPRLTEHHGQFRERKRDLTPFACCFAIFKPLAEIHHADDAKLLARALEHVCGLPNDLPIA